jgi:predicted nucleotide-binding protein
MNDLSELLENFNWENYKEISDALTKVNQNQIELDMSNQASVYSYYHGLMASAKHELDDIRSDLTTLVAKLRAGHRSASSTKLTAQNLDDLVFSDEAYDVAQKQLNEASFRYEVLKGLCRALEHKKDMLVQMSSNRRAETKLYN